MPRRPGLDLLRAIAIVWVLLFHARLLGLGEGIDLVSRFGWMGVDLFFALSGYLIGRQWLERPDWPAFVRRRAYRILPAYAVVLAIYLGVPALREAPRLRPAWQFLTFTENLQVVFDGPLSFTHVWSLCVEEHFYLLFPPIALLVARLAPRPAGVGGVLGGLVAAGIALRAWIWAGVAVAASPEVAWYERIYYPTWCRLDGLLLGVALAALAVHRPAVFAALQRHQGALLALAAGALETAGVLFLDAPSGPAAILGFPLVALGMAALVAAADRWTFAVPGAAPLAAGAYSLYLSHKLVFAFVRDRWPGADAPALGRVPVVVGLTLAVGAALYLGVERPFLRWRDRRRPAPAVA